MNTVRMSIFLLSAFCINQAQGFFANIWQTPYQASAGPLQIGDYLYSETPFNDVVPNQFMIRSHEQSSLIRGAVVLALMQPKNADRLNTILKFLNINDLKNLPSYQIIIQMVANEQVNAKLAIEVIDCIVDTLIDIYEYHAYINPSTDWPLNVVRKTWLWPTSYMNPISYYFEINPILNQIHSELLQIANVVEVHSVKKALHIRAVAAENAYYRLLPIWPVLIAAKTLTK